MSDHSKLYLHLHQLGLLNKERGLRADTLTTHKARHKQHAGCPQSAMSWLTHGATVTSQGKASQQAPTFTSQASPSPGCWSTASLHLVHSSPRGAPRTARQEPQRNDRIQTLRGTINCSLTTQLLLTTQRLLSRYYYHSHLCHCYLHVIPSAAHLSSREEPVALSVGHSRQGKRKKQLLCPTTVTAYDFYRERHFREIETQTNPLPPLPGGLSLPLSQAAHTRTYWKLFSLQICKKPLLSSKN